MKKEKWIQRLTLEEKAALLSGADVWHTRAIEWLNIPSMTLSDGPSGLRKQAGEGDHLGLNASTKATCIPSAATYANSWDESVAQNLGRVVGADARAQGVNVLLGPGLNTKRSPLCGRSFEYYSEDPYLAGKMAAGFIQGVQENGVAACAKHFCANSQEMLRMHSDSVVDERTLRELYLTNFEIAVKEGQPKAVMTSYNRLNGTYTNEDSHLLGDILRGEWGFDGMVVTDWGGSNDFTEGVRAGMNLEMPAAGDDSPCQLLEALKQGKITVEEVDQRVSELLDVILATTGVKPVPVDVAAQHAAAREAAEKSIVLLKNNGSILPLPTNAKVAVIGDFAATPRYQGAGSSMVNAERLDETLPLLPEYFPQSVGYAQGFRRNGQPDADLANQAVTLAQNADAVLLYLGLPEDYETEGLDRTHMRLPDNQVALLTEIAAVNPHIIVVLSAGSGVEMPWADQCQAIVYGCLGGQAAASAMLRVLTGEVNPGGKLAETFPQVYADLPVNCYYPGEEATAEYREGLYVGYRYYETANIPVIFPFGFGLSYTTFDYSDLKVTDKEASFTLTNTGKMDGAEVAQLYVHAQNPSVYRPAKELKGFKKVFLRAGESKTVTIPLDDKAFRYWNSATNRFEVDGGKVDILIGASVQDIRLTGTVDVQGTDAPACEEREKLPSYYSGSVKNVSDQEFEALLGHAIPDGHWSGTIQANDAIAQLYYAKSLKARCVWKVLDGMLNKSIQKGTPDLNVTFIYNMPIRAIGKMAGGMVSQEMCDGILDIVNGHAGGFFKGMGKVAGGFFRQRKVSKKAKELE